MPKFEKERKREKTQMEAKNEKNRQMANLTADEVRFVERLAWSKPIPGIPTDDLIQAGLIEAAKLKQNFNAAAGAKFTTFAFNGVKRAMREEVRRDVCQSEGISRDDYYADRDAHPERRPPAVESYEGKIITFVGRDKETPKYSVEPKDVAAERALDDALLRADLERMTDDTRLRAMTLDRVFEYASWEELARRHGSTARQAKAVVTSILHRYAAKHPVLLEKVRKMEAEGSQVIVAAAA